MNSKTSNLTMKNQKKIKAGPTEVSTELKRSLAASGQKTPTSVRFKNEAQGQMHLIEPSQEQAGELWQYLECIGADKNVLSDDDNRNSMIFQRWFQALVIQNQRFPRDIPVKFVLAHFRRKVVQNDIQIKGFNLREQVRAFHEYLDNYERELRGKWWQYQNPDERPKAIPSKATYTEQEQELSDQERAQKLKNMFGADEVPESLRKFI